MTGPTKSMNSLLSSSKTLLLSILRYHPCSQFQKPNSHRHPEGLPPNKKESTTRMYEQRGRKDSGYGQANNFQVVVLLQGKLADVGVNFKEVLEVRTKNIQASRARTENFVSSVSAHAQAPLDYQQSASPLYNTPTKSRTPQPGYQNSNPDILNLDPSSSSSLSRSGQSDQQLLMMEEAQPTNSYISMRGDAITAIEQTINELGSVFGQLAALVSEQGYVRFCTSG